MGLKLSGNLSRIRAASHAGDPASIESIHFEFRTTSHEFDRSVARGQIMNLVGGPFREDELVRVGGIEATTHWRNIRAGPGCL